MTAEEFYNKHVGKAVDIDGAYSYQCVDLFKAFTKENYGIYNYNCTNGWASGLWIYRKSKPYYQHFVEVSLNELQDGDWLFWNNGSKVAPNSHVAMYYKGKFFGQNQGGKPYASLKKCSTSGVLGVLRPKIYIKSETLSKSIEEIAREVINGNWGNGVDRKRRLENAGYNYSEVQSKVNSLLKTKKEKTNEQIAKEVIQGKWGNGTIRRIKLTTAGYNYAEIQRLVNRML